MRGNAYSATCFGNASSRLGEVNEMDREAHLNKKLACQREKVHESSVPPLEDETTEVKHLFAEPKPDHVSVDGVLCFGKENSWKNLEIEDFCYGFEYDLRRKCGGLDCSTQGQELELGVLDGLLDEVDEVDDFHAANDISGACEDFLLDIELAEKISDLDCAPSRSHLGNSSSESQSPVFSGSSNVALGLSESSSATLPQAESENGKVEKESAKYELNDSPDHKWDGRALARDNIFKSSHELKNLNEVDDARPLESGTSSDENDKKAVQIGKMGALLGHKRLRRPTKRYIEEFSGLKSKHASETERGLDVDSKDKRLKIRSHDEHHPGRMLTYAAKEESLSGTITQETLEEDEKLSDLKSKCVTGKRKNSYTASSDEHMEIGPRNEHHFRRLNSTSRDKSLIGTSTQEPFESLPRRGRPKKRQSVSVFESDDDHSASESEDDHVKKRKSKKHGDRRKHQRMWTLCEVTKLIDGIAQYGTGRWTDIKKLSFSSSAYRTPVDLRDKWRNLLRASSVHKQKLKQNSKEVEEKLKHAMRPLPKTVIRRIRELAILHPYPRFSPGGRYIRRKHN